MCTARLAWGSPREASGDCMRMVARPRTALCQGMLPNSARELSQRLAHISQLERS